MKKTTTFIVLLTSILLSCAQTQTFDIATYKAPKGWEKTVKEGSVSYSTSNETKGTFCVIGIYASSTTKGTTEQEFNQEWNDLAATPYNITTAPETDTLTDDDGRDVIIGSSTYQNEDIAGAVIMYTFVGFGRTTSVLFFTNAESHQKDIEDFLLNFNLKKTVPKTTSANSTTPKTSSTSSTVATSTAPFKPGNNLEGVWMAFHLKKNYYDKVQSGTVKWITFFDNGRVAKLLPDDGMDKYNKNDPSIGYYNISNGKATLQWFKDIAPFNITFKKSAQIEFEEVYSNDIYFHCKSVDGIRLNGTWTSYNNVNDPDLDNSSITKSMITFKQDGSFVDYGVFATDYSNPVPAGSGTYEINNFTLTLHYTNGTVKQTGFTGSLNLDVKTNNSTIYIHRLAFQKMNK